MSGQLCSHFVHVGISCAPAAGFGDSSYLALKEQVHRLKQEHHQVSENYNNVLPCFVMQTMVTAQDLPPLNKLS